ncbi:lysine methyltransferase 5Ab [Cololabis saira]|uniref:lysine methyltransferase 5Ab n=1 Tax=Cololabis saira TaxID=129043 RepID=UPI002AD47026|nr:lysine methyltransferase 5Ab [Cololabis saira]
MTKGKKNVLRAVQKSEDTAENTVASETDTKENKQATKKDSKGKVQSVLQSLWSPSKPRSPLSDSSSIVTQEGNDSEAINPDKSRPKKESGKMKSGSSESKEQKPEGPCQRHGTTEKSSEHLEPKESDVKPANDEKPPAVKHPSRTGRKRGTKKVKNKGTDNRKVTDYFPIRRSNRKTKTELKSEEHKHIDHLIKTGTEEGLQVKHIEGKGRGVFAVKGFKKGDFVVEYHGDLLDLAQAKIREDQYAADPATGCYMYYFQYQSKSYCVDGTKETGRRGRLINHSKNGNCHTKLHAIDGAPHLILVASRDIKAEEELLYDYGDRSKESLSAHPWLKY